jgi:peptide-methionine (S)-S-oxide reductase
MTTEIAVTPATDFWETESERHYPNRYTCHYVRPEWKLLGRNIVHSRTAAATQPHDNG